MISRSGTRISGAASGEAKIFRDEGSGPVVAAGTVLSGLERMFMGSSLISSLASLRERRLQLSSPRRRGSSIPEPVVGCGKAAEYWISASSRAMTVASGVRAERASRGLLGQAEPLPDPRIRVGILRDVGNDGDGIGARRKDLRGVFELDAADRDQRNRTDAFLPFRDLWNALRFKAPRLQGGEEDRA